MKKQRLILFLSFGFSGAAALIYQTIWARQLELIFGTTVYAVSAILSVFFAGLALGSFFIGRFIDRVSEGKDGKEFSGTILRWYAFLEIGIAAYALLTPWIFSLVSSVELMITSSVAMSFVGVTAVRFALLFFALIVPTTLMGATLPVITKFLTTQPKTFGSNFGRLYAVNTLGGVVGTLLVGFVLIAKFGIHATLLMAVSLNFSIGVVVLLLRKRFVGLLKRDKPLKIVKAVQEGGRIFGGHKSSGGFVGVFSGGIWGVGVRGSLDAYFGYGDWQRGVCL